MEVDEEAREVEGPHGGEEDGKDKDGEEDLPDDLNLDNADDVRIYNYVFDKPWSTRINAIFLSILVLFLLLP